MSLEPPMSPPPGGPGVAPGPSPAITIRGLSKAYPIYARPVDRLKEMILRRSFHGEFQALQDVSLTVPRGATVGVIGHNGSGKSTLLQLVAGVLAPSAGEVTVAGRVSALLELGAGFNPEFSGRDNVMLGGAVMGFTREEMAARFAAIAAFAEIGDFIEQPVKTYSSGMYVRLAFALAIHVDPDILLVDEALAVGDAVFQHRCMRMIRELKERGVTILFVSHDTGTVKALCDHAVLLDHGRVVEAGDPEAVVNRYHGLVAAQIAQAPYEVDALPAEASHAGGTTRAGGATLAGDAAPAGDATRAGTAVLHSANPSFGQAAGFFRHGTGTARFTDLQLLSPTGAPTLAVDTGTPITIRAHLAFAEAHEQVVVGFYVKDRLGTELVGSNTAEEGQALPGFQAGARASVDFAFRAALKPGHYSVTVAVAYNRRDPVYLDWVDNALVFEVLPASGGRTVHGLVDLPVAVRVHQTGPAASPTPHGS